MNKEPGHPSGKAPNLKTVGFGHSGRPADGGELSLVEVLKRFAFLCYYIAVSRLPLVDVVALFSAAPLFITALARLVLVGGGGTTKGRVCRWWVGPVRGR